MSYITITGFEQLRVDGMSLILSLCKLKSCIETGDGVWMFPWPHHKSNLTESHRWFLLTCSSRFRTGMCALLKINRDAEEAPITTYRDPHSDRISERIIGEIISIRQFNRIQKKQDLWDILCKLKMTRVNPLMKKHRTFLSSGEAPTGSTTKGKQGTELVCSNILADLRALSSVDWSSTYFGNVEVTVSLSWASPSLLSEDHRNIVWAARLGFSGIIKLWAGRGINVQSFLLISWPYLVHQSNSNHSYSYYY